MTKASDNPFPSVLITEGTEPAAPAAGKQRLYIDSTTHKLKRTDSSGTDVTIESTTPAFVGARAYSSTTQSINDSTETVVTLGSEQFDSDTFHDTSSNTGRMTIPSGQDGKYIVIAQVRFAANATGIRFLHIKLNNSTYEASAHGDGGTIDLNVTALLNLVATDYVAAYVYQTSGGALNIDGSTVRTSLSIAKVG